MDVMTWRSSAAEMKPLLSRSKTYLISVSSSLDMADQAHLERLSDLLLGIGILHLPCHHCEKLCVGLVWSHALWIHGVAPGKSIVPLLSASTSLIMSCSSDSEGFCPSDRMTVPSSFVVICPIWLYISICSVYVCLICGSMF
jgi:hypothetical protein